jgi:hypothetical protein
MRNQYNSNFDCGMRAKSTEGQFSICITKKKKNYMALDRAIL